MPMFNPPLAAVDGAPTIYEYSPANLIKWRLALAKVLAGAARAKIAFVGDSLTAGTGSGTGTGKMTGAQAKAYPAVLRTLFPTAVPTIEQTWFGDAQTPGVGTAAITDYNPKVTFAGSSWLRSTDAIGGDLLFSAAGTDAITFTPTVAVDSFDVYYVRGVGFGSFTVKDGITTLATIDANAAAGFLKQTVTRGAATTDAITIQRDAGATLYIAGVEAFNTATKAVSFVNLGSYGTNSAVQASVADSWHPANGLAVLAPDLSVINLGVNDVRSGVTVDAYTANMQTLITKAKLSGDVILLGHHPDNAPVNAALVAPYRDARIALARSNNCPLIDLTDRFGSYALSSGYYDDEIHLTAPGYADVAAAVLALTAPR